MNDIVIVAAARTAVGKFGGTLGPRTPASELAAIVIKAAAQEAGAGRDRAGEHRADTATRSSSRHEFINKDRAGVLASLPGLRQAGSVRQAMPRGCTDGAAGVVVMRPTRLPRSGLKA